MKANELTDRGALELCAAIIKQQIDDYDKLLLNYFRFLHGPGDETRAVLYDGKYSHIYGDVYRCMRIGSSEKFFSTEWFESLSAPVGAVHGDTILRERRKQAIAEALKRRFITKNDIPKIYKANKWGRYSA